MTDMKRIPVLSTALAVFMMTGCDPGGDRTRTERVSVIVKSTQQTIDGDVVVTEYTWDEQTVAKTLETRTVNGELLYRMDEFETGTNDDHEEFVSCIRTTFADEGDIREKLVTTYLATGYRVYYGGGLRETKYEEFLLGEGGSEEIPVRHKTTEWGPNGRETEIKEYEMQTEVLRLFDFNYSPSGDGHTYKKSEEGGEPVTMYYKITQRAANRAVIGFELYSGWNGQEGTLVEKVTDYEKEGNTVEYKFTKYDENGENPVETNVTELYDEIVLTLTY